MRHLTDPVILGLVMCYLLLVILLYHAASAAAGKTWRCWWQDLKEIFTKPR